MVAFCMFFNKKNRKGIIMAVDVKDVKMINKQISKSTSYMLKQLGFLQNKKLYEVSEDIIGHFVKKHEDVLKASDEPLVTFSVRINKDLADKFATISKKLGIRQDKLLQQAVDEYIKDKKIKF